MPPQPLSGGYGAGNGCAAARRRGRAVPGRLVRGSFRVSGRADRRADVIVAVLTTAVVGAVQDLAGARPGVVYSLPCVAAGRCWQPYHALTPPFACFSDSAPRLGLQRTIPFIADVLGLDRSGGTIGCACVTRCSLAVIVPEGHVTIWEPDRNLIDQTTPPGVPRRRHGDRADDDIFSSGVVVLLARLTVRLGVPAVDHEADLTFCGGAFGVCRDRLERSAGAGSVTRVRPQALVPAVAAGELVAAHEGAHVVGFAEQVVSAPTAAGNTSFLKEVACPAFAARHSGPDPCWMPGRRDLGVSRLAAVGAQSGASSSRRGSPLPKSGPESSSVRKALSMRQRICSSLGRESSGEP